MKPDQHPAVAGPELAHPAVVQGPDLDTLTRIARVNSEMGLLYTDALRERIEVVALCLHYTDCQSAVLTEVVQEALLAVARRGTFTQDFYAAREGRLRQLCEEHGLMDQYAAIMANGTASADEQPTLAARLA